MGLEWQLLPVASVLSMLMTFAIGWLSRGLIKRYKQSQNLIAAPLVWEETKPGVFFATCNAIYWSFEVYRYSDWHVHVWCGEPLCDNLACATLDPSGSGETICATCYDGIVDQREDED
jgi:hypothetical protein